MSIHRLVVRSWLAHSACRTGIRTHRSRKCPRRTQRRSFSFYERVLAYSEFGVGVCSLILADVPGSQEVQTEDPVAAYFPATNILTTIQHANLRGDATCFTDLADSTCRSRNYSRSSPRRTVRGLSSLCQGILACCQAW